jgi:2-iminobutanoate/2-iminopropanoate deaminase
MKKTITSSQAPAAIGPYSQGITAGNILVISGQLPIDPGSGKMPDSVEEQAEMSLRNIDAILREAGFSRQDVIKTTIFLKDLGDFERVNRVYKDFFEGPSFPARSTLEVSRLPRDAAIEIEAMALKTL